MVNQKSKLWTPAIRKYQNLIHLKNINYIFYDIFAKKECAPLRSSPNWAQTSCELTYIETRYHFRRDRVHSGSDVHLAVSD